MMNERYRSTVEIIQNAYPGSVTLDANQVCEICSVSRRTLARMRTNKTLEPISGHGCKRVYTVDAVARYLTRS